MQLIGDEELRLRMGMKVAEDAKRRFDLEKQGEEYLRWYREIVSKVNE